MAITPAAEAVHVPAHLALLGSPAPPAQSTLTGAELPQAKVLRLCTWDHFSCVQPFVTLWTVPCQASLSGVLQARILQCIGQYWLPYPPRALYFLLPYLPTSRYMMLPELLQPKQLHHLHTWPSLGQTQVLQSSLRSKPQWTTHLQRWK